jgi:hypothetical protein
VVQGRKGRCRAGQGMAGIIWQDRSVQSTIGPSPGTIYLIVEGDLGYYLTPCLHDSVTDGRPRCQCQSNWDWSWPTCTCGPADALWDLTSRVSTVLHVTTLHCTALDCTPLDYTSLHMNCTTLHSQYKIDVLMV